jgi:O-antigen/teichoic acid export membrane protein
VTTAYLLITGCIVAGFELLGRWVVRLLAAPEFYPAHEALPWLALGWALYGLYLVLVSIAGRAKVTIRTLPAAVAGLVVNVVVLVTLVPSLGIEGAAIALCASYVAMLVVLRLLTRKVFDVRFEWGRIGALIVVAGGIAVAGNLLLPTSGAAGFLGRLVVFLLIPLALVAVRAVRPDEIRWLVRGARGLLRRGGEAAT